MIAAAALTALAASAVPASAGVPDGPGPWADFVQTVSQGTRADGTDVLPDRSDPLNALGVAERNTLPGTFFSLGFGGSLNLGFDNVICNGAGADVDLELVEATNEPYPPELVDVFVSKTGEPGSFVQVANDVDKDAFISLPASITFARFVRLEDASRLSDFDGRPDADGYDVDGIRALHTGDCVVTEGRMTGGGSVFTSGGVRVTHGFTLYCDGSKGNLEVNSEGNKFHLETLTEAICTDDPAFGPEPPTAGFDTYDGKGVGRYNGTSGYTAEWTFTDSGEPGVADQARIVIRSPGGAVVLAVSGPLEKGNHQAHGA